MVFIYFLYITCFIVLWWGYFGYYIFIKIYKSTQDNNKLPNNVPPTLPSITMLVPCFNEEKLIVSKIQNVKDLHYPREQLNVKFLDGGSTDATLSLVKENISDAPYIQLIETGQKGKIAQINHVLQHIKTDIVINTDVDAQLEPNILVEMVKEFQTDEQVAVVGALVIPQNCCDEEAQYWNTQNKIRILESEAYSSSIVIAPCYGFRAGLIDRFPDDVIADDIYIAFEATVKGLKVSYCKRAVAYEIRTPAMISELIKHKFRKTNAYITEVLRFLYHLPKLNAFWRIIFLTRTLHVIGLSWFLLLFLMLTLALFSLQQYSIVLFCFITAAFWLLVTHKIINTVELPESRFSGSFSLSIKTFLIMTFVLIIAGITFPLFRQTSCYEKINSRDNTN